MSLVAALLAAVAVLLALPSSPRSERHSLTLPFRSPALLVPVAAVSGLLWWQLDGSTLVLSLIGLGVVAAGLHLARRTRVAKAADARSAQVLATCDAMAADLAAGQPSARVLERAAAEWDEFRPVAIAARMDADVPAALRALATRRGAEQATVLAAAWQVAHRTGSGLAQAIAQSADGIREERRTRRLVASELASADATARLMAALPLFMVLLGISVGGDPIGFLTGTSIGLGCLAAGLVLSFLGMLWLHRIADGVLGR